MNMTGLVRHRARLSALLAGGALLAGCGGSSGPDARPNDVAVAVGPQLAAIATPVLATPAPARHLGAAVQAASPAARARYPGGARPEAGPSGARTISPCRLVTPGEAATITGRPMARVSEAPLGPTCIYQPRGAKRSITLAVQAMSFAKLRPHMRILGRRAIRGRTAYCVNYGGVATFVPLPRARVLEVTASCPVGARFAVRALGRLPG